MLTINDPLQIPLRELEFDFVRSGGPGGQNVNKVNSKAVMKWNTTWNSTLPDDVKERFRSKFHRRINQNGELIITSQRFRDRGKNVADCLAKLRLMVLEVAEAPTVRKATKPTKGSQRRRLDQKRQTSQKKQNRRSPRMDD